jgi:DNA-binding transcriptional regulator YiaG
MDHTEFKAARLALGVSASQLARMLQLGDHGGRTVRRWEADERPVPGPVAVLINLFLEKSNRKSA